MKTDIITFGKYKNQPLEVLMQDNQYKEWLMAQDWFRNRHSNIYNLIVNNYGEPCETPEHNKLVSLFLDDDFCISFFNKIFFNVEIFEKRLIREVNSSNWETQKRYYTQEDADQYIDLVQKKQYEIEFVVTHKTFETKLGNDVGFGITVNFKSDFSFKRDYQDRECFFSIECKPNVSEDYPAIIRQCRAQKSNVLFIEFFDTKSITIDQFRKMFPDIAIVLLSDITATS
jgi:hypothetical protein